ncbi:MAG TPA: hypothetical protein VGM88_14600 [Kofleriaceae bacterium]|jgi:uncharacterized tellurite resistance protein B-like protein
MAESQILSVIRMWAAVAWADGVLAVPEAEGLRRLIAGADLTDGERAAATQFTSARIALPDTHLTTMPADTRKSIYRAACRMALVDHVFAAQERAMLDRLQTLLGVTPDAAAEIEADVPGLG